MKASFILRVSLLAAAWLVWTPALLAQPEGQPEPRPTATVSPPDEATSSPQLHPAGPASPWTEEKLLARILTQNPGLLAAQESVEAARAEQKGMESELWPILGVNGQFTAGTTERMSMPVPGVEPANMSMRPRGFTANLNVTAMYPLFTGGKLQAQVEGAKRRVQQAEAEYAVRRLELRAEAQLALLTLRWQTARADLLHAEVERQAEDLRLAEERFGLGKDPRYVVLRSQSELARLQQELNLTHLEIHHQQAELHRLAALPAEEPLFEAEPLRLPKVIQALPAAAEAERMAVAASPSLAILQAQVDEAETRVQIAQASYLPFIYLVGVYEQRIPEMPEMNYTSGGAIDLLIALPVFDGFRRDAEFERFQRDSSRLLNAYTDARNRLQTDTTKLLLELEALAINLDLGQAAVEQRAEEYRIARMRYTGGKAILLEMLDAANQLRAARLDQLETWFRYESARLRFEQLIALDETNAKPSDPEGTIRR